MSKRDAFLHIRMPQETKDYLMRAAEIFCQKHKVKCSASDIANAIIEKEVERLRPKKRRAKRRG